MDRDELVDYHHAVKAVVTLTNFRDHREGFFLNYELLRGLTDLCKSITDIQWAGYLKADFESLLKPNFFFTS